jgi:hypothetical protein
MIVRLSAGLTVGLLVSGLLVTGCLTTGSLDQRGVAGTWRGWVITSRDFVPVSLEIRPDGAFEMSGWGFGTARSVSGVVAVRDGQPRLEGSGGWHGPIAVSGAAPHRVLRIVRDDQLYTARLVEVAH